MCAAGQCPLKRQPWHVEKHCVKIFTHFTRNIPLGDVWALQVRVLRFERVPGRFERPDFLRPTYVFLDRENVRKYFLGNPLLAICMKISCWVKFRSRAKFDAESIGSTLGDPWDL